MGTITKLNKKDLGFLGVDFQYVLVRGLMEEPGLLESIDAILNQNAFTDAYLRTFVGVIKDLFAQTQKTPSYNQVYSWLANKATDETDLDYYKETLDKVKRAPLKDIDVDKNLAIHFFKQQEAIKVSNLLRQSVAQGGDVIEKTLEEALKTLDAIQHIGEPSTSVITFNDATIKQTIMRTEEDRIIPTFIPKVDEMLGGGARRGEVNLFIAATGYGKTTWARVIGYNMAMTGCKVVSFFFEEERDEVIRSGIAQMVKHYPNRLKGYGEEKASEFVKLLNDGDVKRNIESNYHPVIGKNKVTTVEDIEKTIDELRQTQGFTADVLIIDYFSCLKYGSSVNNDIYNAQADCMRKLVNTAKKYSITIWVMQQTNRIGVKNNGEDGLSNIQGSYQIAQPCTNVIQLLRSEEQKQNNTASLSFLKTRHAPYGGVLENIVFNNGLSKIECSSSIDRDSNAFDEDECDRVQKQFELTIKKF